MTWSPRSTPPAPPASRRRSCSPTDIGTLDDEGFLTITDQKKELIITAGAWVRRFRVLPDEWTTQTGELTPTMKRRRHVITERYAKQIDQLCA